MFGRAAARCAVLVVAATSFAVPLFAESVHPLVVSAHDERFIAVRRLAIAAGQSPPEPVTPMAIAELHGVLKDVDPARLPVHLHQEYKQLLDELSLPAVPNGHVGIEATVESYLHTGADPASWRYWYPDRKPLLSIPFRIVPVRGIGISASLDWRKNYPIYPSSSIETVNPDPLTNVFSDLAETDVQFPFEALVTAAGTGWSAQFGRSRVGFGLGHTGSLLITDHVDYHDFFLASLTGRFAGYRALYLDLEPWLNGGGTDPDRAYFAHRIELRPTDWLSLAANEAMVFHGKNLELRYLSPLMILHSWFLPNYANTMINLEVSVRPMKRLHVWGHLAIDQIQSAVEEARGYADSEPEAMGFLAGAEYVVPFDRFWLNVGTEWVFLDPWMYVFRDYMANYSYRRRVQAENALPAAKIIVEKPLGYPAGPDHFGITGFATADIGSNYMAGLELGYYGDGENTVARTVPPVDDADAARTTPSGAAPEFTVAARFHGDATILEADIWSVPFVLSAGAVLDLLRVQNYGHVSGQEYRDLQLSSYLSLSTRFSPRRR